MSSMKGRESDSPLATIIECVVPLTSQEAQLCQKRPQPQRMGRQTCQLLLLRACPMSQAFRPLTLVLRMCQLRAQAR